ncbi:DMT family transporter [Bacillus ginsengihumi]|uniref:DMT family transporter n=1 Tax=Heyndrickxia ginsengihumi TaxID=363870 RepID=A0A6M0P901_9BACI|nr:DMT family transporter [Heyndrickxia ginsengihumi]NEY20350.1 DMT family transporter [Heyndrickxia ginsengihumi]
MIKKKLSEIALLFVAFVWGATFVIVQHAIQALPPFSFNAIRFLLAGLLLLLICIWKEKGKLQITLHTIIPGFILGLCLFTSYTFQTIGLLYTTPAKAGFITGLSVVLVPILSYFMLKHRAETGAIIGSILAAVGLYLLAVKNSEPFSLGDLLVLISAFGFAFHILCTDRFSRHISVLLVTTIQILTVSLLSFISAFLLENWRRSFSANVLLTNEMIMSLFITAILATAAAFFIQTIAQRFTTPSRVAIILTMEPVFAAITSFLWIHEKINTAGLLGCLLILIGMVFTEIPFEFLRKRHKKTIELPK